jgi:hypothetical protein
MGLRDVIVKHRLSEEISVRQELYNAALKLDIYGDLSNGEKYLKLAQMSDSDLLYLVLEYAYALLDMYEFKN